MALIKCPECSNEVSDQALACPKCGMPLTKYVQELKGKREETVNILKAVVSAEETQEPIINEIKTDRKVEVKASNLSLCPECKSAVSNIAKKCGVCGEPLNGDMSGSGRNLKKRSKIGNVIFAVLFCIAFVFVLQSCSGNIDSNSKTVDDQKGAVWAATEDIVRSNLKAPSTAKFPFSYGSEGVSMSEIEPNKWHVEGWVDAENGFGANIRSNFSVDIIVDGDYCKYENLKIE